MAPAKKPRGRPATNKVTKPAPKPTRRSNDKLAAAVAAARESEDDVDKLGKEGGKVSKRGRKAKQKEDDGHVDDKEEDDAPFTSANAAKPRGRPKMKSAGEEAVEEVPESAVNAHKTTAKRGRRAGSKSMRNDDSEIPETQPAADMDVDTEQDNQSDILPTLKHPARRDARPGISTDLEMGEVQLRRRLGEANRKYENLEQKYCDLRDIGIKTAERNFDMFKKESDERAKTATELISHLKADLTTQRTLAKEGQVYKTRLEEMEAKVADLAASLAEAKQEAKTLSTKLAASRSAEAAATAVTAKVPGSAIKGGTAAARALATASTEAAQTAQLKEDLYGDLTGLIVRVVKRDSTGQVFDCIQTGRNGTLHFKLEVETDTSGDNYEEAHFTYKPQLDSNRDRDLIDLLPDFLAEEIEFSRPHAAKFYSRVTKSLMD
ncbi:chromosome segregation protein [Colletotrichum karsti]|uniref:Chromosome segregation protein n=1 Tax=Colletotrichum karsti TaxID=1095194 RepID=A0A9P6IEJ3_9PEZI|nr:chromosome segregation protein [Colletotrichum karsti]KAF9881388.1 chromosome segregation protein [Colletotrichum karsti]